MYASISAWARRAAPRAAELVALLGEARQLVLGAGEVALQHRPQPPPPTQPGLQPAKGASSALSMEP